jgi:hypothetical protein
MSVHGPASALITLPGECWPHAPAAADLAEQVMDNALRGLLADASQA